MQEHKSEKTDFILSGHHHKKELTVEGDSTSLQNFIALCFLYFSKTLHGMWRTFAPYRVIFFTQTV